MEEVIINDVLIHGEIEENENGEFILSFNVEGENNYHLHSLLFTKDSFDIEFPHLNKSFNARIVSYSTSNSESLNDNSIVNFRVTFKEFIEGDNEESEWNDFDGIAQTTITNWVRVRALFELLEEKGILTKNEIDNKINEVGERDFEDMLQFIKTGEYPKKDSEGN